MLEDPSVKGFCYICSEGGKHFGTVEMVGNVGKGELFPKLRMGISLFVRELLTASWLLTVLPGKDLPGQFGLQMPKIPAGEIPRVLAWHEMQSLFSSWRTPGLRP